MVEHVEVENRARDVRTWYDGHRYKCRIFEERFTQHLERALRNGSLEDAKLETRTKSVESLVLKALKQLPSGEFKYTDPRAEITDVVGARILVPLSTDLAAVVTMLKQTYHVDEELERGDEEAHVDVPGYRSLHFLVRLKEDDRRDVDFREFGDMTVELQVRTQLQHAWASLQHDLMYKTERAPTPAVRRRLIALAGLLELADREFVAVRQAHSEVRDEVVRDAPSSDTKLTASALRHIAENIFGEEDRAMQDWFVELKGVADDLGISTASDLDSALSSWRERGPQVAATVRVTKPWVNSAYLLDLLLRLALRERYIDQRPPHEEDEPMTAEDLVRARQSFLSELDSIERAVATE